LVLSQSQLKPKKKIYIRPYGFLGKQEGKCLEKQSKAIRLAGGNRYFTKIEIIEKTNTIIKESMSVEKFLELVEKKKNQNLLNILTRLTSKRTLLNKKPFKKKNYYIFGILNVTPDSFSDGGDHVLIDHATNSAHEMVKNKVDFIDVGGESTRPGANKVRVNDEILRTMPIIQYLHKNKINISLDTRNSETMKLGLLSGVSIINDVSALTNSKDSVDVIKEFRKPVILMHMPGNPKTMMNHVYKNFLLDIYDYLEERIEFCIKNGILRSNIIIDPGIGFGKVCRQNIEVLKNISIFHSLGCPIMLGASRKRFISNIFGQAAPKERLAGSISVALHSFYQGVQIYRVHDVFETKQALEILNHIDN